jgi:hypothetical protein
MKKAIRYALLTGMVAASLAGPVSPANAKECVGISYDQNGPDEIGTWDCGETCPSPTHGPLDGRFHVVYCVDPA